MTQGVKLVVTCGLLLTMAVAAWGQPPGREALATVRWAGEAGASVHLLGFVADAAGHVVAHVIADDSDRVIGADFVVRVAGNEYAAQGVAYNAVSGLALLRITTDPLPVPYTFARDPVQPERAVYGAAVAAVDDATDQIMVRRGSVSRIEPSRSTDPATIWHNALAGERRHGAPLFNNCGEAAGVIVERAAARGTALAVSAEWLVNTFGGADLEPVRAAETCLSEADQATAVKEARRLAERQAAVAVRTRNLAVEARREAEETRDAAVAARNVAVEARDLAVEARREAEETRDAAVAAAAAAWRYVVWAVAGGALVSVLLAGLWLACRRSLARAEAARDAERLRIGPGTFC